MNSYFPPVSCTEIEKYLRRRLNNVSINQLLWYNILFIYNVIISSPLPFLVSVIDQFLKRKTEWPATISFIHLLI